MPVVRVLVVEDSLTVRRRLCETLASDPGVEVVGEASDGKRAIELCRDLRPDVVSLDMILPVMSGLSATEYIMAHCPTPILIVSSSVNRGELFKTYDALAAGAVDVLEKPRGDEADGLWEQQFLSTIKLVSRIKVITHPRARLRSFGRPADAMLEPPGGRPAAGVCKVVGIGASTGGPAALVQVFRSIPPSFSVPLVVVLHIGEPFAAAFAEWLESQTGHRVVYARGGEIIATLGGTIVMAPPERHLVTQGGRLHLSDTPERHSCRPSVDVLLESIATDFGSAAAACLLTGMGRDGAYGLLEIKRAGGRTMAQDEASSVVYGMPREAALLGAADRILPLTEIGPAIATLGSSLAGASP